MAKKQTFMCRKSSFVCQKSGFRGQKIDFHGSENRLSWAENRLSWVGKQTFVGRKQTFLGRKLGHFYIFTSLHQHNGDACEHPRCLKNDWACPPIYEDAKSRANLKYDAPHPPCFDSGWRGTPPPLWSKKSWFASP